MGEFAKRCAAAQFARELDAGLSDMPATRHHPAGRSGWRLANVASVANTSRGNPTTCPHRRPEDRCRGTCQIPGPGMHPPPPQFIRLCPHPMPCQHPHVHAAQHFLKASRCTKRPAALLPQLFQVWPYAHGLSSWSVRLRCPYALSPLPLSTLPRPGPPRPPGWQRGGCHAQCQTHAPTYTVLLDKHATAQRWSPAAFKRPAGQFIALGTTRMTAAHPRVAVPRRPQLPRGPLQRLLRPTAPFGRRHCRPLWPRPSLACAQGLPG